MSGVNKVMIIGNLGQDPETKYMPNGNAVTNISVATSESWKDKQTGQRQERTEWHRIILFNRLAEIAGEYLRKGSKVYIEGSIRTRKWQDQSGQDRYSTEIVARELQMLDSKNSVQATQQQVNQPGDVNERGFHNGKPAQNHEQVQKSQDQNTSFQFDDDIPFL